MQLSSRSGFTLIELLVVIAIIGILATGAISIFSSAQASARDAARQGDINAIASAMALAQSSDAQQRYPAAAADLNPFLSKLPVPPRQDNDAGTVPATGTAGSGYLVAINGKRDAFVAVACGMSKDTGVGGATADLKRAFYVTGGDVTAANVVAAISCSAAGVAAVANTAFRVPGTPTTISYP